MKKVVNLEEEKSDLLDVFPVTCLYNGEWDTDLNLFGCTGYILVHKSTLEFIHSDLKLLILECVRRQDPPNGKIQCESKRYAAGTSCFLTCDKGYIPLGKTFMTCKEDEDTGDFDWNIDQPEFVCVRPIGMFPYSIFHLW